MSTQIIVPMRGRSPDEPHRTATTLELLFDLVFVVAIAQAAAGLHHSIADGHASDGIMKYVMVFFAIWWAWMGFTWFATSFDTDDVVYRLTVLIQLAGALILAAGVTKAFAHLDFTAVAIGYVVMRVAVVSQWIRAGRANPVQRDGCMRMAVGVSIVQALWVGLLFMPESWFFPGFWVLILAELAIPVWAWQKLTAGWNRHHIAERYGLLTIIVLGESILAASFALSAAIEEQTLSMQMLPIMGGGLMTVFAMWWLYFDRDAVSQFTSVRSAFVWGYGHYLIFAAGAAVGAGLAVSVDHATHHAEVGGLAAGMSVAIPVALFLASLWILHVRDDSSVRSKFIGLVAIGAVLAAPLTSQPVLVIGLLLMALVARETLASASARAGSFDSAAGTPSH